MGENIRWLDGLNKTHHTLFYASNCGILCRDYTGKTGGFTTMEIRKSSEDYLETMLMLKEQNGYVRSIDIAKHLNVTKPSVSYATKRLRENGYIEMNNDGLITLTDSGMAIAHKILDRHKMLSQFLIMLGVDKEVADEDACNIEHDISNESFEAICNHVDNFMSGCPRINSCAPDCEDRTRE